MANTSNSERWYFTKEQLESTPSRKYGFDAYKELQYRQQAANFIQDMGQRLQVSQLCINTAIVYMHRFYVFHSFTNFPWYQMAAAALFLAAKVEEQPRKLEYVIRVANICRNPRDRSFDINSERYAAQSQDLVFNENVLLQTLGFDVAIDHPHTYVVRCCHLVRASKDLAQTSYFMASNSLHLTTMCIQYKPTVVACFCILLACKWSNWEIPLSNEKKEWYTYVDPTVTAELLQQLTNEFLVIFENCPSRLKEKIGPKPESSVSPLDQDSKGGSLRSLEYKGDDHHKHRSTRPPDAASSSHRTQEQREREYKERKEKERIAHMSGITLNHQSHHHRPERPPGDPTKMKQLSRQPPSGMPYPGSNRNEPRDILREAAKDSPFGIPTVRDPNREHGKELLAARSDKEVPKRDAMLGKPGLQTDTNITNYSDVRHNLKDPNRPRTDPNKSASKAEIMRRYEDQKPPHVKTETDVIRKHLTSSFDKNSAHHKSSSSSSTSHKSKSPFSLDSNKSVPKTTIAPVKPQFNGNVNGSYDNKPPVSHEATDIKTKTEPVTMKEEIPTPAVIKRPSLFSPDQTPDHPQLPMKLEAKAEPLTPNLSVLSPITSPPSVPSMRNRNYSSSSEPELRPTMKKIDQVEGFENLMRDSTIGMSGLSSSSDTMQCSASEQSEGICKTDISTEIKEPSMSQVVNGLETNPSIISDLLKGVGTTTHLPGVAASTSIKPETAEAPSECAALVAPTSHQEKEHRHKSKKKKDKHKHKDKGKSKEEKEEKKRKHKDKNREKHKHKESNEELPPQISEPIKIKIQKDKIQQVIPINQLKIKIPKDKIRTESIGNPTLLQSSSGSLKIKIPKEIITNCNQSGMTSLDMSLSGSSSSRKRDRDRSLSSGDAPASKQTKSGHRESKQNGRHSYTKVAQGDGEWSVLRLAESKYTKGSS
ncbi:cyclin-T1 isoform X2 [Euwallacea similis]|uniref:cyclin-T1 isoform X2 n=1 Tax=Euwallacea similis TaxID=1736056 RepID=UPI003450A36D